MSRTFSILIVDDIPLMRLMFTKYVKGGGKKALEPILGEEVEIEVVEAGDGVEAKEALESGKKFDLCFLDLMMPQKDGLTLLREIRADDRFDDLKVVICSAVGEREVVQAALDLGAVAYIEKPFTLESVKARLVEIYGPIETE